MGTSLDQLRTLLEDYTRRVGLAGLPSPATRPIPPRPPGLHRLTYGRLLRERRRLDEKLQELPRRRLWPSQRKRLATQFRNRLARIEQALGCPVARPQLRAWYRIGEAAALLHVSAKTVLRWERAGRLACERGPGPFGHRYFHQRDLLRVAQAMKP